MRFSYDDETKVFEIGGVKYDAALFGALSFAPIGTVLRIVGRGDGVVTVTSVRVEQQQEFAGKLFPPFPP